MLKKLVVTVLAVLLAASLCPARTIEDVDLPETMEIGDKTVALNGGGVRKSMYLKTYVGGLYVREVKTEADDVINADEPMAIRLHMIEDVDRGTMKTAIHNGFRSATGDNIEPIESEIDQFMDSFSEPIKKGDVFDYKYLPGEGIKMYKQDEHQATIPGLEFKKAMFGIWFSDKPADEKLKKGMLAGDIRVSPEKLTPEGETAVAKAEKSAEEKAKEKAAAEKEAKEKATAEKAAAEKEAADKARAAEEQAVAAAEKQPDVPATGSGAEAKAAGETAAAAGAAAGKASAGEKKDRQVAVKKSPEKNLPASATVQEAAAEETAARSKTEKPEKEKAGEKVEEKAEAAAEKQPAEKAEKQAEEKAGQKEQKAPGTSVTRAQVVEEDIYFDVNDASLSDQALDRLARKKEWLSANSDASVYVEVYCDYRGSEDYNTWLAHKRGRSVKTYLVNEGVDPARIRVKIRGEEKSSGGENMEKSRRAHFEIRD